MCGNLGCDSNKWILLLQAKEEGASKFDLYNWKKAGRIRVCTSERRLRYWRPDVVKELNRKNKRRKPGLEKEAKKVIANEEIQGVLNDLKKQKLPLSSFDLKELWPDFHELPLTHRELLKGLFDAARSPKNSSSNLKALEILLKIVKPALLEDAKKKTFTPEDYERLILPELMEKGDNEPSGCDSPES